MWTKQGIEIQRWAPWIQCLPTPATYKAVNNDRNNSSALPIRSVVDRLVSWTPQPCKTCRQKLFLQAHWVEKEQQWSERKGLEVYHCTRHRVSLFSMTQRQARRASTAASLTANLLSRRANQIRSIKSETCTLKTVGAFTAISCSHNPLSWWASTKGTNSKNPNCKTLLQIQFGEC